MAEQEEIDAALDAALDELDDDDEDDDEEAEAEEGVGVGEKAVDKDVVASNNEKMKDKDDKPTTASTVAESKPKPVVMGPPRPPAPAPLLPFQPPDSSSSSIDEEEKFFAEMMAQVQSQFSNSGDCSSANEPPEAFLERLMQEMQLQLQSDMQQPQPQPPAAAAAAVTSSSSARSTDSKSNTKNKNGDKKKNTTKKTNEVDQAICNLIEDMAKRSNQDDNDNDDDAVDHDDEMDGDEEAVMLQQLIKGLGELTGSGSSDSDVNADAMIDGMMEHLMSKDLMYEPMKQVADKFPQWLQERKNVLSTDEYAKREKQFECFQQLVHVYETDPNNNSKLVLLMQQVQEYGQPPAEIIQEIAPGLDLDPDGVPKFQFPGSGGGGAGLGSLPPGMNEEDCVVM